MNRRSFMRWLGLGAISAVTPAPVHKLLDLLERKFVPEKIYELRVTSSVWYVPVEYPVIVECWGGGGRVDMDGSRGGGSYSRKST